MNDYVSPYSDTSEPLSSTAQTALSTDWKQWFLDPISHFFIKIANSIPDVIIAICILLIGWLVGRILQFIVSFFLRCIGFDSFAGKVGISKLFTEGGSGAAPHKWMGSITLWTVMAVSLHLALNQLNLHVVSVDLSRFMHFIITVMIGLMVAVFGMFLSFVCARVVLMVAKNTEVKNPTLYAEMTRGIVLLFTLLACSVEIGLPPQIIVMAVGLVLVTLCITFILCFGLGGTVWAGKVLEKTLSQDKNGK